MIPTKRLLLLVIFLIFVSSRIGWTGPRELPAVPDAVREALIDRDFDRARAALMKLKQSLPDQADFWTFLEARSFEMEGDAAQAAGRYNALASSFPSSAWRHKADYRRAELLRGLGAVEEAEAVWAAALLRLRGLDRQDELAEVYLSAADEVIAAELRPDDQEIDWSRADDLYGRALDLQVSDVVRDRALRGRIRCNEARKDWPRVFQYADQWIATFGGLSADGVPPRGDEGLAIYVRSASARVIFENYRDGRRMFEDLLRDVPRALEAGTVQLSEWPKWRAESIYWIGQSWRGDPVRSVSIYEQYLQEALAPRSTNVLYEIAIAWQRANRSESALAAFDALLAHESEVGDETQREHALELRMRVLYEKGLLLASLDRPDDAIATLRLYTTRYPSGPLWTAAQLAIESTLLAGIRFLENEEREAEARAAIEEFLAQRPLHEQAASLRVRIGESWRRQGWRAQEDESVGAEVWEADFRAAIAEFERVVKKYPDSAAASDALYQIGNCYALELNDPRAAVDAFRRCNFGPYASRSSDRRREMISTRLELDTERVWRSNEAPQLSLVTRNLKELELRIFELNLESYFRKYSTVEFIGDLDLDLIAPDQRITLPVPDYAPYALSEFQAELPMRGPGVWAVAVVGEELTSTTLVIVSDIDVIAKTSRREVFVFAQDMRADVPAADVRVLCTVPTKNGLELQEAFTDESGVVRFACDADTDDSSAHVLAMRGSDVATCGSEFGPLLDQRSTTHRVFAHTDRPAYRRGDTVRWRVVPRRVVNGSDHFEVGDSYEVRIVDSNRQPVWQAVRTLNEYGTLHGDLALAESAPTGGYLLTCSKDGKVLNSLSFRVEDFELRRIELELSTDEEVYYRGEVVKLEASARFHYGSPVANAHLALALPDGRLIALTTDDNGVARYEYDTRDHLRSAPLEFEAALTEEGVEAALTVRLATQGFQLIVNPDRDAIVVGDELLATVRASVPDGKPIAQKLQIEWIRMQHGQAERRVHTAEVVTNDDGAARVAFRPETSGDYLVRAIGEDRFGNPISGTGEFEVAGDDDPQRLRFFAQRREFAVGEVADLELVDRMGAGIALITIETDRVLSYRIARLQAGKNLVRIEMENEHAPNVRVSVSKMLNDEFEFDYLEIDVDRGLRVSIAAPPDAVEPGSEVSIDITVTDLLGNPLEAELSLAIVDEALFDLFPTADSSISKLFAPLRRNYDNDPLRTASSCEFSYSGDTETIAAALIEEQARLEEQARWEDRRKESLDQLGLLAAGQPKLKSTDRNFGPAAPALEEADLEAGVGIGGGGGGVSGGRFGGKRSLQARGKNAQSHAVANTEWLDQITAYWNPSVITGADGRATLQVTLPRRSTRWRISSHGVGRAANFGDGRASLVTRSQLFVELLTPPVLTEGDRPTVVARVHNTGGLKGELRLILQRGAAGEPATTTTELLSLDGQALLEVNIESTEPVGNAEWLVRLDARGNLQGTEFAVSDQRRIPVRPWGLEVRAARSGSIQSRRSMSIALPADSHLEGRTLNLRVGRGVDESLLDALLNRGPHYRGPRPTITTVTDEAWSLLGLIEMLEVSGSSINSAPGVYADLIDRARGVLANLISQRTRTGAMPSCYGERQDDMLTTAAAAIAIGRAREFGFDVSEEDRTKLRELLLEHFRKLSAADNEEKALVLHALARVGADTTDYTSRLFRDRLQLSSTALAHLTLALVVAERTPLAAEVATVLASRVDDEGMLLGDSVLSFHGIDVERRALALLALHTASLDDAAITRLSDSLLANRPWAPQRARGLAVAALASIAKRSADRAPYQVIVTCNGRPAQTIQLDDATPSGELRFQFGADDPEELQIDLEVRGKGTPEFVAQLDGSATVAENLHNELAQVWRLRYVAAPPLYLGKPLPVGFSTVGNPSSDADRNTRHECELGDRFLLQVRIKRGDAVRRNNTGELQVVEIPLPPGTRVDEQSLRQFDRGYALLPGRLIVYLGDGRGDAMFDVTLVGLFPGEYRVLPAVVRSLERPQVFSTGAVMQMRVLPRGVASEEPYDPSPDEQYELARLAFWRGDRELARVQLQSLYRRWSKQLENEALRQTSKMLLDIAIEADDHESIIEHFEVLGEKSPELYIDYDDLLAVAAAYRSIREHENALRIERALCIETFGTDLKVAGALAELGDFQGSIDTMRRLWLDYPDVPMVVESSLTLSDRLLEKAPSAFLDPKLMAAGKDRAALTLDGILELQRFLAIYADDPQVADAALNLLSALFELEDYERAEAFAARMAAVAKLPRYVDAFLYSQAIARWQLGRDEGAKELLARIADALYTDAAGRKSPSENRDLALYLLGQIHHARQEFAEASAYYERVAELFSDAQAALAGFRSQRIELDEVTEFAPGDDVTVELRHRNLPEVELLVYPVDLMTLYLRERSLSNVAGVQLAGIAPLVRRTVQLPAGVDLRDRKTVVSMELNDAGAYLVMVRAGEQFASGLVLISDLTLEVDSDVYDGRVRVQVMNRSTGAFERNVDVRVIGSGNVGFVSGRTDPRGLFVADGIIGSGTVIARAGERRYAFMREVLGVEVDASIGRSPASPGPGGPSSVVFGSIPSGFFDNVQSFNKDNRSQRSSNFDKEVRRERKGLQVQQVK